jgi:hypothetical protein
MLEIDVWVKTALASKKRNGNEMHVAESRIRMLYVMMPRYLLPTSFTMLRDNVVTWQL